MNYIRKCPLCSISMDYSSKSNFMRAKNKNSTCRSCSCKEKWKNEEMRKRHSVSRKKYLSEMSEEERARIDSKISDANKMIYKERSEEWKNEWKKICSLESSKRWIDPEYKLKLSNSMKKNNWSKREDSEEIKSKQLKTRLEKNGGLYTKNHGRCQMHVIKNIKCYGSFEKKYIEILLKNNLCLPKNVEKSIETNIGTYTPDFEFDKFYVEVKSRFTYEVLIGNKSYSKSKKSNPKQAEKIKWVSQNIKEVRIAIIDGETIEYILLK